MGGRLQAHGQDQLPVMQTQALKKRGARMSHSHDHVCASTRFVSVEEQCQDVEGLRCRSAHRLNNGDMVVALRMVRHQAEAGLSYQKAVSESIEEIEKILEDLKKSLRKEDH